MASDFDKFLSLDSEGFDSDEEKRRKEMFQSFKAKKYKGIDNMDAFDYAPPKTFTPEEADKKDFENFERTFQKNNEMYHDIKGFENWGIAWDMNDAKDANLKDYGAFARGEMTLDEIKQRDQERRDKIAMKRGLTRDDLDRWDQKKNKGLIWGLSDTVNDIRDMGLKSALITAGYVTVGAIGGALVGFAAGGVGAVPGALMGAELGLQAAGITAIAGGTLWDTAEKESASSLKKYMEARPNATAQEFEKAKQEAAINGLIDGAIEAGAAQYFSMYGAKIASRIPGINKVTSKIGIKEEEEVVNSLRKAFSGEGAKEFVKAIGTNIGVEFTTEEAQNMLDHVAEYRMGILKKEDMTPQALAMEAADTAGAVFQKTALLAIVGAGADVRSRVNNTAEVLNKKIDAVNAEYEAPEITDNKLNNEQTSGMVLTGKVEKTDIAQMRDNELSKINATANIKIQSIDSEIANTQAQINNASDLGLEEKQVSSLEEKLQQLQDSKQEAIAALREIGTERAIRQAKVQTDNELKQVSSDIQTAHDSLSAIDEKIQKQKTDGKDVAALEAKKIKTEEKINTLETQHQTLLENKIKLDNRENLPEVLKNKNTTIPSTTLVNIEKNANASLQKADEKSKIKINKILEQHAKDKVNSAIKAMKANQNMFVKGYQTGAKEQISETKTVNSLLTKALLEAGIKRNELAAFDSLKSKIVHITDLVANKKNIEAKIGQVFEARNKEHALRITDKLRSLAKPFKSGKNPKGKMTAAIQTKVNRMFSFANKTSFEAGLDVQDLAQKFSDNQNAELSNVEKAKILTMQNNEKITANTEEISALKDSKQTPKTKWDGLNKEREDVIKPDEQSVKANIKELISEKPENNSEADTVHSKVVQTVSKALNMINMGFEFKNLTVRIKESVFTETERSGELGNYDKTNKTLAIAKDGEFSVPHEIGHYFDNLIGQMFSGNEMTDFSNYRNFDDVTLKNTVKKLDILMKAEAARVRETEGFKNLDKEQQNYLTKNSEIFARIFTSMYNKEHGISENNKLDFVSKITDNMPAKTISTFKSILDSVAQYRSTDGRIFELQQENTRLEDENSKIMKDAAYADKQALLANVPSSVAEIISELELSSDLKNRSSADIMKFNEYVSNLIQEGRDLRAQKEAARKEQLARDVETAITSVQGDKPIDVNKTYSESEYQQKQNEKTKLSVKQILNKALDLAQRPTSSFSTLIDLISQDDKTRAVTKLLDYMPSLKAYHGALQEQEQIFNKNMEDVYGVKTERERENLLLNNAKVETLNNISFQDGSVGDLQFSKETAMTLWGYLQNKDVRAVLRKSNNFTTTFRPELGDEISEEIRYDEHRSIEAVLENFLSEKDKQNVRNIMKQFDDFFPTINAFYGEKYNINLGQIDNYLPLIREKTLGEAEDLMANYQKGLFASIPSSFATRTRANKTIEFEPITQLAMDHFSDTLHYIHYDGLVTKGATILSNRDFKNIVQEKYGNWVYSKLLDTFKATANPRAMQGIKSKINTLYKLYSSAAIGYNMRSGIKQALSFTNYATEVNPAHFSVGLAEFMASPHKMIERTQFLFDNSPLLRARQNNINLEMSLLSRDKKVIDMVKHKTWNRFQNHLYILSRYGDAFNVAFGGYAVYKAKILEGSSHEQAIDFMERQIYKYNQSSNIEDLNTLQLNGGFAGRGFTMFKSDVLKLYNAQIGTFREFLRGNISAAETAKRTAFLTTNNLMSLAVDTAFAPTKAEVASVLVMGQLASLPLLGEFLQEMIHLAFAMAMGEPEDDKKPFYGRESLMVDPTSNMAKFGLGVYWLSQQGYESTDDVEDWWKVYSKVGKPALKSIGVPTNVIETAHDFINPDTEDDFLKRLPTTVWTRYTLKERHPEMYSEE